MLIGSGRDHVQKGKTRAGNLGQPCVRISVKPSKTLVPERHFLGLSSDCDAEFGEGEEGEEGEVVVVVVVVMVVVVVVVVVVR
jgi:hypothetical protein